MLSTKPESLDCFRLTGVLEGLAELSQMPEIRQQLVRLIHNCACSEALLSSFRSPALLAVVVEVATVVGETRGTALGALVKLSLDRECALLLARSPIFTTERLISMFLEATSSLSSENLALLKLIRNVADYQPELVIGFDTEIITSCIQNKDRQELLCDVLAVANRAKMTGERAIQLTQHPGFIQLIVGVLKSDRVMPQIHLESIMFISSVVVFPEAVQQLMALDVVTLLLLVMSRYPEDLDIQTQALFAFYRMTYCPESRGSVVRNKKILDAALVCAASKNAVINQAANLMLDAAAALDPKCAGVLKLPRFDAFNQEWMQIMGRPH
jgi:hypothetical protein